MKKNVIGKIIGYKINFSICTIFGDILASPYELQHGYIYVAVPFGEKFKFMDYMAIFGRLGLR